MSSTAQCFLAHGFAQRDAEVGPQDGQHDSRHAAPGADVQHRLARLQQPADFQAVDQVAADKLVVIRMPGEVQFGVPVPEQPAISLQKDGLLLGQLHVVPNQG